ncbi:MAG: SDR family oxidoreductase [Burkholderiales bacterium]|nr:SDR family oxidoreductase [Burkholderiales bacterium]MDQ3197149.1 SDR family oxidoreductase [Pseudomonadota bacterium]
MIKKIAVVTGANRGIGLEICRQLAGKGLHVLLTSRDRAKGEAACASLGDQNVRFAELDVADAASIERFAEFLSDEYGAADVLVNNAGVMLDAKGARVLTSPVDVFKRTMDVNVFGPLLLCQALVPLMRKRDYGRVVNLSSGMGQLADMQDGTPAYRMSKTALNALTRMLAAASRDANILVNAMCPGWIKTDMGGPGATLSVAEGADTAVWLATLPDDGPRGGLFRSRQPIPW